MENQHNHTMQHTHPVDELFQKRMKDPAYAAEYARVFNDMSAAWAITEKQK